MNLQDLATLIISITGKKLDLFIADSCLLGSINALDILRSSTKYVLASPSYCDYLSFLETKSLFRPKATIVEYSKRLIKEIIKLYRTQFQDKSFMIHFCLYAMNKHLAKLIQKIKENKNLLEIDKKDICAINQKDYYYADLLCTLSKHKIDISNLIHHIIIYNDYFDIGQNRYSDLILILEKPYDHFTYQDPFLI
jgi:hypothetical protein